MSKWIDKDLQKHITKKIDAIKFARRELSNEEIEEIMPKVIEHYKEHLEDDELFYDGGVCYILLKTLPKPKTIPPKNTNDTRNLFCKSKIGIITVFGTDKQWAQIGWDSSAWVRGKIKEQFDIMGYKQGYYKSLEDAIKGNKLNEDDVPESDVLRSYTFNIWQIIE